MKKSLSIEERAYSNIITFLEGIRDFHPEYFNDKTVTRQDLLSQYYFWGRDIDVDDIFEYRKSLLEKNNGIKRQAESALDKFLAHHGVKKSSADYESWLHS